MSNKKEIAVAIKDIHKEFILPQHKNTTFKQTVVNIVKKNNKVTQKVLDGVDFDIYKGDFFGIVGRNGSGKSTLLKLIAGVYYPTGGSIELNGGLTPFIELGVGFNPELSGRDNIFLNGALLGYDRIQMAEMYDEIVDFAELGPFMDQKLKNYSSGMQVRLAFSIAIKAKNDVLIFDEVLAVGDEAFQRKCLDVFEKYKAEGQTVILVTHDMETVRQFCNRAVLIHEGKVVRVGDPRPVADKYQALNQQVVDKEEKIKKQFDKTSNVEVTLLDKSSREITNLTSGKPFSIDVKWKNEVNTFVINIFKNSGEHITAFRVDAREIKTRHFSVELSPRLGTGKYYILTEMRDEDDLEIATSLKGPSFIISKQDPTVPVWSGIVYVEHAIKTHE